MKPITLLLFFMGLIYNYTEAALNNGNVIGFILFLLSAQYRTHSQSLRLRHRFGRLAPGDRVMGSYRNQPSEM